MEIITFILSEIIYYLFLGNIVTRFNDTYLANSCILLFLFSMIISIPSFICLKFFKNRKNYYIISSILIISSSLIILLFREFTKSGITNFAFHMYTILFMLVPFSNLFLLTIHKLTYPDKKKKQLVLLIVSKKIFLISLIFVFSFVLKFESLLTLTGILDFITNIISPFIGNFLLKYQD